MTVNVELRSAAYAAQSLKAALTWIGCLICQIRAP
jgi:hypothetical protein